MNKKNDIRYHEVLKQAAVYSYKNGNPIPSGYRVVKSVDNINYQKVKINKIQARNV